MNDHEGPKRGLDKLSGGNASLLSDLFAFVRENKKWWLLPIVGALLVVGVLVLLSATAAGPFIYTLF